MAFRDFPGREYDGWGTGDWRRLRMWLVDLHCHTAARSADSSALLGPMLRAAASNGVQTVCLTDHDAFSRPGEFDGAGASIVTVVAGAEINTDDGHVLVFGLPAYRFGFHHARTLAGAVAEAGGALVLAHPYRRAVPSDAEPNTAPYDAALRRAGGNPLLRVVDAVEVANGRGSLVENSFACDLARMAGLPGVAGSDAHRSEDAGVVATEFDDPVRSVGELVQRLKSGRFRPAAGSAAIRKPGG